MPQFSKTPKNVNLFFINIMSIEISIENYSMNSIVSDVVLAVSDHGLGLSDLSLALSELLAANNGVLGSRVVNAGGDGGLETTDIDTGLVNGNGRLVDAVHGDLTSGIFKLNSL